MARQSEFVRLVDALGREIAAGELAEGAVLNLTQLESRFGVSRTVARETMRQLQALGMITAKRRVGLIVQPISEWDVLNPLVIRWRLDGPARDAQLYSLTDLRAAIEPTAARLAAKMARPEQGERLLELSERLVQLGSEGRGDEPEYLETDVEYHQLLLRASHNEMLTAFMPAVGAALVGRNELGLTPRDPTPLAVENHRVVARAILAGDEELAEAASRHVVRLVRAELPGPADMGKRRSPATAPNGTPDAAGTLDTSGTLDTPDAAAAPAQSA
jgi:DNA-binding FadR family transcriptional regulator